LDLSPQITQIRICRYSRPRAVQRPGTFGPSLFCAFVILSGARSRKISTPPNALAPRRESSTPCCTAPSNSSAPNSSCAPSTPPAVTSNVSSSTSTPTKWSERSPTTPALPIEEVDEAAEAARRANRAEPARATAAYLAECRAELEKQSPHAGAKNGNPTNTTPTHGNMNRVTPSTQRLVWGQPKCHRVHVGTASPGCPGGPELPGRSASQSHRPQARSKCERRSSKGAKACRPPRKLLSELN
jgi:hypothetical protein